MERDLVNNEAKSLDDIFKDESGVVKKPVDLNDIFSSSGPQATPSFKDAQLKYNKDSPLGEMMMSFPVGVSEGLSLGYSDRALPSKVLEMAGRHPVPRFLGKITGGLLPGVGVGRGVKIAGETLPYLSALAKPGFLSGMTEGAILGGTEDPGENGSRITNAAVGAGIGGGLGFISKLLGYAGSSTKTYDEINDPSKNYAKKVKSMIDDANQKLMQKEVAPRQAELNQDLMNKRIEVNPEDLRGVNESDVLPPSKMGKRVSKIADLLEQRKRAINVNSPESMLMPKNKATEKTPTLAGVPAKQIKQYFDQISDYQRAKPYATESSVARDELSRFKADLLRGKLAEASPKYSQLNEPMSDALTIRNTVDEASKTSPMALVASDPMTDRGQMIQELDRLAGSKLAELGRNIKDAKELRTKDISLFRPLESSATIYKKAKLGTGRVANKIDRVTPEGTRQSTLSSILQQLRNDQEEQQ